MDIYILTVLIFFTISCIISRKQNYPIEYWNSDDLMYFIIFSIFWPFTIIIIFEVKTGIISKFFKFIVKERHLNTDKKNEKS